MEIVTLSSNSYDISGKTTFRSIKQTYYTVLVAKGFLVPESSLSTTKVASLGLDFHFPILMETLALHLLSKAKK